jgi:hypothetical protein
MVLRSLGKLAGAIRYALSRWEGLTLFIDDGRIELDNQKECVVRRLRRRSRTLGIIASLIETCKINDVNPLHYLTDVITRIVNGHPNSDRSAVAMGLPKARTQSRGLRTTLTSQRHRRFFQTVWPVAPLLSPSLS